MTMNKSMLITIGVSAYNEERNIRKVVSGILMQKQVGWQLKEVLIYSDGSSDTTVQKVKPFTKNGLVKVFDDGKRMGKTYRIQQLFGAAKGEVIVMFDADIKIKSKNTITYLVSAFKKDRNVMLVGGNTIPFPPGNFFQKGVYSTFKVFYKSRTQIRNGDNLFACTGACIAIRKKFAREINFPEIKNQDTFLFFSCRVKKYGFKFVPKAIVYYKLPNTLSDYLAQIFRSNPEAVKIKLTKYFGDLVAKEYEREKLFYLKTISEVFIRDPLPVLYIIFINLFCRPFFRFISKSDKGTWNAVQSTK